MESAHPYHAVTGLFGNPGQMGGFQAFALVALLLMWQHSCKRKISLWWVLAAALIAYPLLVSGSRAALLAALAGGIVVRHASIKRLLRSRKWMLPAFVVLGAGFLIALYYVRPASADGRLLIWRVSAGMMLERPWTGFGPGGFARYYMLHQASWFALHPDSPFTAVASDVDYPFNELVRVGVEHGISGVLLTIALVVAIFLLCRRKESLGLLIAYLVFACFSYPSYKPGLFVVFPLSVIYALDFPKRSGRTPVAVLCVGLSLLFFAVHLPEAFHPAAHPTCAEWCRRGELAMGRGENELAGRFFREASWMVPSRTRPPYLLWKLALQENNLPEAEFYARRLLDRPVKVPDTFTIRARAEVAAWLENAIPSQESSSCFGLPPHSF